MNRIIWLIACILVSSPIFSSDEINLEKEERLAALMELNMEELGEVEVKLDDVFDIFDGLVKVRKVSVASGVKEDASIAPAVTTLITAQDIEAVGARTLDEALQMVPGLHVGRRGAGYGYIYTMRGIHTNPSPEVLVLMNGIPLKKPSDGRIEVSDLPASLIQRIEVIRGPGSALYGADAFSGVINVITKTAADIQGTEVGVQAGSFRGANTWIAHGKYYDNIDLAVVVEHDRTDGHNALIEEDAQTRTDKMFGTRASLAPNTLNAQKNVSFLYLNAGLGDHWRWRASGRQSRNAGSGLGLAQALDPASDIDSSEFSSDLSYQNAQFLPNWELAAQLSYQFIDSPSKYTMFPRGAFGGIFPEGFFWNATTKGDQTRFETNTLYRGWANHRLRLGAGWQQSRITDVHEERNWDVDLASGFPYPLPTLTDVSHSRGVFLSPATRQNLFGYLQDSWAFDPFWDLTVGVRYDHFSDFGATTNPRAALVWKTTPSLTTKLLYGSAFRAPTFMELSLNNPLLGMGNSSIKPEMINTWELAWDWLATPTVHVALNLFHYRIKDKIGFPAGQIQWENYGKWKGTGFEFETRWKVSNHAALLFNYAYQNGEDEKGNPIADALQKSAYLRLDWMFYPNWFMDVNARWISDRPRAINDTRPQMKDYLVTDFVVRHKQLKSHWNIAVGVRNLLNQDAREPTTVNMGVTNDLPLPKREFFGEIRYKF
jgi:outer membrane cobalamin receptor